MKINICLASAKRKHNIVLTLSVLYLVIVVLCNRHFIMTKDVCIILKYRTPDRKVMVKIRLSGPIFIFLLNME